MQEYSVQKNNIILLCFFICTVIFFWLEPNVFFLRDDLYYIIHYFAHDHFKFMLSPHWGEVMPIFRTVYFSEIFLFGKNTVLFQLLGLVLLGIMVFLFNGVYLSISARNTYLALVVAVMMIAHPDWAEVTLWVFEMCIILQLFFQAVTIVLFLKYIKDNKAGVFFLFIIALILQNYSFGNGIFFPLLFIFGLILERGFKFDFKIILLAVIQVAFILIQKTFAEQSISLSGILHDYRSVLLNYYIFISVSITRFFIVKLAMGNITIYMSLLLFFVLCFFAYKNDKKKTLLCLAYFFISSISIPIARPGLNSSLHYYYTTFLFPPLFLLLYIAISNISQRFFKPVLVFFLIVLCGYFFTDLKAKRIYGYLGFKNKERLMDAIIYSKEYYYPYDDLYVTSSNNIYMDNMFNPAVQRSIQKNNYFEIDSGIQHYFVAKCGKDSAQVGIDLFKARSKSTINSYKLLCNKSFINFDINYERQ